MNFGLNGDDDGETEWFDSPLTDMGEEFDSRSDFLFEDFDLIFPLSAAGGEVVGTLL